MLAHEEGILRCFVEEYGRCGGPKIELEELRLRWHLVLITYIYDSVSYLIRHGYPETSREEFSSFTGVADPEFQRRFYTRCGALPVTNCYAYYMMRGDLKSIYDTWAAG